MGKKKAGKWPIRSRARASSKAGHLSLHTVSMVPGDHVKDRGGGRANVDVQHLREATETEKEPSLERSPITRNRGPGGLRAGMGWEGSS